MTDKEVLLDDLVGVEEAVSKYASTISDKIERQEEVPNEINLRLSKSLETGKYRIKSRSLEDDEVDLSIYIHSDDDSDRVYDEVYTQTLQGIFSYLRRVKD